MIFLVPIGVTSFDYRNHLDNGARTAILGAVTFGARVNLLIP